MKGDCCKERVLYRAVISVMSVHNSEVKETSTTFSIFQTNINKHIFLIIFLWLSLALPLLADDHKKRKL